MKTLVDVACHLVMSPIWMMRPWPISPYQCTYTVNDMCNPYVMHPITGWCSRINVYTQRHIYGRLACWGVVLANFSCLNCTCNAELSDVGQLNYFPGNGNTPRPVHAGIRWCCITSPNVACLMLTFYVRCLQVLADLVICYLTSLVLRAQAFVEGECYWTSEFCSADAHTPVVMYTSIWW